MQDLLLSGRYRLGESIGRGGMGRVWRAYDEVLNRTVAVKELTAAQYAADSDRRVLLARTQTEARAAARINHPAVVTIHDVLEHDDRPWIVMELIEGGSLADVIKESGPLDAQYAARVGLWVLRALRAAHTAGVLHRDVKPGNVLLADDGRVLLTDFGIAQVEGDTTLTKTGEIVGSVDYLAPERVRGADPGPACDLWALGATLYTAVDGHSPFRRGTPLATMQAVVDEEPAAPEGAGVLGPVITALLYKDPVMRPTAEDTEAMLVDAAEGRWPAAVPVYPVTATDHYDSAHPYDVTHPYDTPSTAYTPTPPHGPSGSPGPAGGYVSGPSGGGYTAGPSAGGQGPYGTYDAYAPSGTGAPGSGQDGTQPSGDPNRRPTARGRRWGTVVMVVVAAVALVGGGTVLGLHYAQGHDGDRTTADPPGGKGSEPSSSATTPPRQRTDGLPEGWRRVHDPKGFSLAVPDGWTREVDHTQIDYTPDHGNHFIRISVDDSPDWGSAYEHQIDLEKRIHTLPHYRRIRLESNAFRDQDSSLWEFDWTADPSDTVSGPRHAIEQTYFDRDGTEYAIYMSSPAVDWNKTHDQFKVVLRSWQP